MNSRNILHLLQSLHYYNGNGFFFSFYFFSNLHFITKNKISIKVCNTLLEYFPIVHMCDFIRCGTKFQILTCENKL